MSDVRKYEVDIEYQTFEKGTMKIWAASREQAAEIALASFHDVFTEKCQNPIITGTLEIVDKKAKS